jgi:CubicO group peptidase (beta-lactamase class C family)
MQTSDCVTHGNWGLPPYNRWSLQRVQELFPTARLAADPTAALIIPTEPRDVMPLSFEAANGNVETIGRFLERAWCDSLLVVHDGANVAEHYFNGMSASSHHLLYSVTKAFVGMLAGIAVGRDKLEVASLVTRYLPELGNSAWHGTTVRHLLDMTAAAQYSEDLTDPETDFWKEAAVVGWQPALVNPKTPPSLFEYARSLQGQDMANGSKFEYRTVCANVLGMVLERAMGARLAQLLETEIWSRIGAHHDASIVVDRTGFPYVGAGMSACTRDLGVFGLMMINDGAINGRQVIPAAWIEDTLRGDATSKECFAKGQYGDEAPGWHFRNQLWISGSDRAEMLAIGIHGQYLYMDKSRDLVIVMLSSQPEPYDAELDLDTLAAMRAVGESLQT